MCCLGVLRAENNRTPMDQSCMWLLLNTSYISSNSSRDVYILSYILYSIILTVNKIV